MFLTSGSVTKRSQFYRTNKILLSFLFIYGSTVVESFCCHRNHQVRNGNFGRGGKWSKVHRALEADNVAHDVISMEGLVDINLQTNVQIDLSYDDETDRFVRASKHRRLYIRKTLKSMFVPEGVSSDYYGFMIWRVVQRYINAILQVFGTQSLLLSLGKKRSLTQAAALNWILKDTLGKLTRMLYGSFASNKLDADAKRWRFRSSILFALGNLLEIITFIRPRWFLPLGTAANSFKQISMLTSSATRNTILSNFSVRGNIGDITAKGEAQIAVVDLLGIASGITISKLIGVEKFYKIILLYAMLQSLELICMYKEISSVVFRRMNFERLWRTTSEYLVNRKILSPTEISNTERIFFAPDHFCRRSVAYGSISRSNLDPSEVNELLKIFHGEKYIIVVGRNLKKRFAFFQKTDKADLSHIILHADADNEDIVKSTFNLAILRRNMNDISASEKQESANLRTSDCVDVLSKSKKECDELYDEYRGKLEESDWLTTFLFGRCSMRSIWPISDGRS